MQQKKDPFLYFTLETCEGSDYILHNPTDLKIAMAVLGLHFEFSHFSSVL